MDIFTPSPTPPLPKRLHPPRIPLPPVSISPSTVGLVPAPLFSKGKPVVLRVTVRDLPALSPDHDCPTSPKKSPASHRSSTCSTNSSSEISAPNSPSYRPRSLAYDQPAPLFSSQWNAVHVSRPNSEAVWRPPTPPMTCSPPLRKLRRRPSPKKESLRSLRMKDSEACLQRAYEERLEAYLSGEMFARVKWREDMGSVGE